MRTREEILDAAIKLFARRGIDSTTMAELAKAIHLTPGALYWHFPGKEDLVLAALEELHQRYLREFGGMLGDLRKLSARAQLTAFFEHTRALLAANPAYGTFFAMVSAETSDTEAAVSAALRSVLGTYVQVIANVIRYGQDKTGEFRKDFDASTLAHAVVSGHLGIVGYQNLFSATVAPDRLMSALDLLLGAGIAAAPPERCSQP